MIINPYIFGGATPSTLWDGLVAYYTADNTPNDATGNGNDGTLINGATYGTGIINQGFSLDGVNDYVNFTGSLGITNDFSISLWVNPTILSGIKPCMQSLNSRTFANGSLNILFNTNKVVYQMKGTDGIFNNQTSIITFTQGNWYNIIISYNDTAKKADMYINGVKDASSQTNTFSSCNALDLNNGFDFGMRQTSVFLSGYQDEIALWNRQLTASEVTELYNGGAGLQYTP